MIALLLTASMLGSVEVPSGAALRLPPQVQAQPGQPFAVVAETNLKWIRFIVPPGLTRVPIELTACKDRGFVGYGPEGVYEFRVEGTLNDQFVESKCVVFVGRPSPVPPQPGPAPVPVPTDPLLDELQRLFSSAGRPVAERDRLVRLWRDAAADLLENAERRTLGSFTEALHRASQNVPYNLKPTDLKEIRERMAVDLRAACPTGDCPLGDAGSPVRVQVADLLKRYAIALSATR